MTKVVANSNNKSTDSAVSLYIALHRFKVSSSSLCWFMTHSFIVLVNSHHSLTSHFQTQQENVFGKESCDKLCTTCSSPNSNVNE